MTRGILGISIDERFLEHRRRSTSLAAMAGGAVAVGVFEYRLIAQHRVERELFSVLVVMAAVKLCAMLWFRFTD